MAKTISPSKFKKDITSGQIGKLEEMVGHGIRKSGVFQNVLTADIDRFIKNVGPDLRDAYVKMMERRFRNFVDYFDISVNYDEPEAIAKAIEAAKFDWKHVGLSPAKIPLIGSGQTIREVREVHLGKTTHNYDLPNVFKEWGEELGFRDGFKFADPLTALCFARNLPDRQRKYPLVTPFVDNKGQAWYLYLYGDDGKRYLRVCRDSPNNFWGADIRFLVICKLPMVA